MTDEKMPEFMCGECGSARLAELIPQWMDANNGGESRDMGFPEDGECDTQLWFCERCESTVEMRSTQDGRVCGHSKCSQHYIDTGRCHCVEDEDWQIEK